MRDRERERESESEREELEHQQSVINQTYCIKKTKKCQSAF